MTEILEVKETHFPKGNFCNKVITYARFKIVSLHNRVLRFW